MVDSEKLFAKLSRVGGSRIYLDQPDRYYRALLFSTDLAPLVAIGSGPVPPTQELNAICGIKDDPQADHDIEAGGDEFDIEDARMQIVHDVISPDDSLVRLVVPVKVFVLNTWQRYCCLKIAG